MGEVVLRLGPSFVAKRCSEKVSSEFSEHDNALGHYALDLGPWWGVRVAVGGDTAMLCATTDQIDTLLPQAQALRPRVRARSFR